MPQVYDKYKQQLEQLSRLMIWSVEVKKKQVVRNERVSYLHIAPL